MSIAVTTTANADRASCGTLREKEPAKPIRIPSFIGHQVAQKTPGDPKDYCHEDTIRHTDGSKGTLEPMDIAFSLDPTMENEDTRTYSKMVRPPFFARGDTLITKSYYLEGDGEIGFHEIEEYKECDDIDDSMSSDTNFLDTQTSRPPFHYQRRKHNALASKSMSRFHEEKQKGDTTSSKSHFTTVNQDQPILLDMFTIIGDSLGLCGSDDPDVVPKRHSSKRSSRKGHHHRSHKK
ncbi:hypothetical protein ACA910_008802 [Epithemia clementina (nom. ined.)]